MRTAERPKNTTVIIFVSARGTLNPSGIVSFVILFFLLMVCTQLFSCLLYTSDAADEL